MQLNFLHQGGFSVKKQNKGKKYACYETTGKINFLGQRKTGQVKTTEQSDESRVL